MEGMYIFGDSLSYIKVLFISRIIQSLGVISIVVTSYVLQ